MYTVNQLAPMFAYVHVHIHDKYMYAIIEGGGQCILDANLHTFVIYIDCDQNQ